MYVRYTSWITYVTLPAVVPRLDSHATVVAVVDKPVSCLRVEFVQHGHGGILGSSEGGEFPMPLPRHGEKGVPPIHQVTHDQVVWVGGAGQRRGDGGGRVEEDGEEHFFVFVHGLVDFG